MLNLIKKYYGNFTSQELHKFTLLGLIFSIVVGVMWVLMPVRDTLFCERIIGFSACVDRQAREIYFVWARVIALFVLVPLTVIYGRILNRYQKSTAFYIVAGVYALIFFLFFLFFSLNRFDGTPSPLYWSGWLWFICVESFNALFIATFWAFVIDTSDQLQAQKGFGLIVMLGQLGGIVIPTALYSLRSFFNFDHTMIIGAAGILLLVTVAILRLLMKTVSQKTMEGYGKGQKNIPNRKELGIFEGIRLIGMYKYLAGIALLVIFFEYIINILDFNFKTMVFASYANALESSIVLSRYALSVNVVTLGLLILGINNIQRLYGIRWSFITTFFCVAGVLLALYFVPTMTVVMMALILTKSVNYALNSPSIKQLYIPTSTDVKYQSQAWIETFGFGGARALASLTGLSKYALGSVLFMNFSSCGSFALLIVWIVVALGVTNRWTKAIDKKEIIC